MASNFLGDAGGAAQVRSRIISSGELISREGVELHKSMNFKPKGPGLSVFLVLRRGGEFTDTWDERKRRFSYQGHDSTTVESGKMVDQILMYESGKLTDNGKFYKEADGYKGGVRKDPLHIQVYEKLDPGVWYDKGIFALMDAARVQEGGRKVVRYYLAPMEDASDQTERFLSTAVKEGVWKRDGGRCSRCGRDTDLYFVGEGTEKRVKLLCGAHSGKRHTKQFL